MISALGHCEDPACAKSQAGQELVRLFRCSIHCDRLLCLFHLNAHDIYYEEEKKQNDVVLSELQNCLTIYQSIFEQQIQSYRELVHQATTLILRNSSALVPADQIRPVLDKLKRAIALFQPDRIVIKNESPFEMTDFDQEKLEANVAKDFPLIKKEPTIPTTNRNESGQKVVVRIERIDYSKEPKSTDEQSKRKEEQNRNSSSIQSVTSHKSIAELSKDKAEKKRNPPVSPAASEKKKSETIKKKSDKTVTLKRLQT